MKEWPGGQTITGLGKWWGRKPLILVRATILGLLMPASSDPKRDREIFLKILSMDNDGLELRRSKNFSIKQLYEFASNDQRLRFFQSKEQESKISWKPEIIREEKNAFQNELFRRLSYDQKLAYCRRPEQLENIRKEDWDEVNNHLGSSAVDIAELVQQLGKKHFGHIPRVGDAFCGGGSIPFEAARIGCESYGSDLNPVAALLTWAALNIIGGGEEVVEEVRNAQKEVYDAVDKQFTAWGIEHNEKGWRADAYLYCVEARDTSVYLLTVS